MGEFYNISYGEGIEGILNWSNEITDGWFVNLFILFIFTTTLLVLMKSEWKMSGILSFCFLLSFITALIFSTITKVNPYIIFVSIIGVGISVTLGIMTKNK